MLAVIALLSNVAHAQAQATAPPVGPGTEPTPGLTPEPTPPARPLPLDGAPLPLDDAPMPPAAATTSTTSTPTPTLTPESAAVPPLVLDQPTTQETGRPVPFYRKDWFWGAVGVVILTTAVILVSVASSGTDTPNTTLGNMRAF